MTSQGEHPITPTGDEMDESELQAENARAMIFLSQMKLKNHRRKPHHGRGGSMHVGRVRIAAAAILSDGLGFKVNPEDIKPIVGAYKSSLYDVFRWELFATDGRGVPVVLGCWDTLTLFVREAKLYGFHVDDGTIHINEKNSAPD
jgi:hypothetical protein